MSAPLQTEATLMAIGWQIVNLRPMQAPSGAVLFEATLARLDGGASLQLLNTDRDALLAEGLSYAMALVARPLVLRFAVIGASVGHRAEFDGTHVRCACSWSTRANTASAARAAHVRHAELIALVGTGGAR